MELERIRELIEGLLEVIRGVNVHVIDPERGVAYVIMKSSSMTFSDPSRWADELLDKVRVGIFSVPIWYSRDYIYVVRGGGLEMVGMIDKFSDLPKVLRKMREMGLDRWVEPVVEKARKLVEKHIEAIRERNAEYLAELERLAAQPQETVTAAAIAGRAYPDHSRIIELSS